MWSRQHATKTKGNWQWQAPATATNTSKVASTFIFDSSKLPNQSNLVTLGLMERKKEN
jgi:hypothetical protein